MRSLPAPPSEPEIIDPWLEDRVSHPSFEAFFDATQRDLHALLTLALLDESSATEAATEAYALAAARWADLSTHHHPEGWVYRTGLAHAASTGVRANVDPLRGGDDVLLDAFAELYQQQRALLTLRILGGWTDDQISAALDLTDDVGGATAGALDHLRFLLPAEDRSEQAVPEIEDRLQTFFDQHRTSTVPLDFGTVEERRSRLGRRRRMLGVGLALAIMVVGAALLASTTSNSAPGEIEASVRGTFPGESIPPSSALEVSDPTTVDIPTPDLDWRRVHWEFGITEFAAIGDAFVGIDGPDRVEIRPTDGNPSIRLSPSPFTDDVAEVIVGQDAIAAVSGEFFETLDVAVIAESGALEVHRYALPQAELDETAPDPPWFAFEVVHADGTLVVTRTKESTEVFAGNVGVGLDVTDLGYEPGPSVSVTASNGWFVLRSFERNAVRSRDGITWEENIDTAPFDLVAGGRSNPIIGFIQSRGSTMLEISTDGGTWSRFTSPIAAIGSMAAVGDVVAASGLTSTARSDGDFPPEIIVSDGDHEIRFEVATGDDQGAVRVVDLETGLVVLEVREEGDEGVRFRSGSFEFFDPATGEIITTATSESMSRAFLSASGRHQGLPMTMAVASIPPDGVEAVWDETPITAVFGPDAQFVEFVAGNGSMLAIVTTDSTTRFYVASTD